jgi:hypothetical protein
MASLSAFGVTTCFCLGLVLLGVAIRLGKRAVFLVGLGKKGGLVIEWAKGEGLSRRVGGGF